MLRLRPAHLGSSIKASIIGAALAVASKLAAQSEPPVLRLGPIRGSFGVQVGDPHEELGTVTDVAQALDGSVFVLDAPNNRILVLDSAARFVTSFGRPGAGPGEFRTPTSLAFLPAQRSLWVLDQGLARVTVLSWDGKRLQHRRTLNTGPFVYDLCAIGARIVLYEPSDSDRPVIRLVDTAGVEQASFGVPFGRSGGPTMQMAQRGGLLACEPKGEAIALASKLTGELRLYSVRGELRWTEVVQGFLPVRLLVSATGFSVDVASTKPADLVDFLAFSGDGAIVLQLERKSPPWSRSPIPGLPRRYTRLVSGGDGRELGADSTLPRMALLSSRLAVSIDSGAVPRLELRALLAR